MAQRDKKPRRGVSGPTADGGHRSVEHNPPGKVEMRKITRKQTDEEVRQQETAKANVRADTAGGEPQAQGPDGSGELPMRESDRQEGRGGD